MYVFLPLVVHCILGMADDCYWFLDSHHNLCCSLSPTTSTWLCYYSEDTY
ncbi:hypothetical protein GLYMA_04G203266v4 [Glycine max]|nr:hypothetical protein GLYMA_04G203266v4 [Glycine max]KAH1112337.1 hypothetical protein GYH30_010560 [Glycine max]